jgi:hypothetical protein
MKRFDRSSLSRMFRAKLPSSAVPISGSLMTRSRSRWASMAQYRESWISFTVPLAGSPCIAVISPMKVPGSRTATAWPPEDTSACPSAR